MGIFLAYCYATGWLDKSDGKKRFSVAEDGKFIPEDKNKQTAYTRVTDVGRTYISKLFKDKKNPEKFDIYILSKGQELSHSLQYKDGKWGLPNED
ncbi:hypothetical protein [Chryseobacterium viscerum]|uniref:Uncharacterized protein n=1 Tax=Chryseobacterium viscerum TaxID=1037377 RepID=A0A316WHQ7_9FLAO|nr:hypothetical protein [Chryseobacterium viscerum]PWN60972.1 hypothetical protein C1634_012950 [Chryseobacterium viscerum]